MSGIRKRVKIMNDYGASWPLWNETGPAKRDDFALSEGLALRLEHWARCFNDHFDWEAGWDDHALKDSHRLEAHKLRDQVSVELGPGYTVTLDLWEV